MTTYRLVREEPGLYRVLYRAHGRIYAIQNDGGFGRQRLNFYACSEDGKVQRELDFIPDAREFDVYLEP